MTEATALPMSGNYFCVGGTNSDGFSIKLIEAETGRQIKNLPGDFRRHDAVMLLDPTGKLLGHQVGPSKLRIYSLPSAQLFLELNQIPDAISPLGEWFARRGDDRAGWLLYDRAGCDRALALGMDFQWT